MSVRDKLLSAKIDEEELQSLAHQIHSENNCECGNDSGETFTLRSEGAGDIEMCLDCYGALDNVY